MNILFLTIGRMKSIETHSLYPDLLRQFRDAGHQVYIVSPREKKTKLQTELVKDAGARILYVKIGNITKCNLIEKGISTLLIEPQFKSAIKKYFSDVKFDLIMYSTPPITFANVIKYVKKRDGAKSYLLLKDIFPQNSVDLGMLSKTGIKGLIYKFFRQKEKKLYALSDKIGCMSQANCDYVLKNNPFVLPDKVEVCPNSIEPQNMRLSDEEKAEMRQKYGLPTDKKIFVYGGNLGKPQDIPFVVKCLKACQDIKDAFFAIAGSGTDRHILEEYVNRDNPENIKLLGVLPKEEYDRMIACCDVGLIFLDHRFTIPNFPSRLLAYMQAGLPVLACTDVNTDIGQVVEDGGFGWWCESDDALKFKNIVMNINLEDKGETAYKYLLDNYDVKNAFKNIMKDMV